MKLLKHFWTITYHKWLVLKGCFRIGLYRQGLLHDLSKYSPSEFIVGVRFFQGTQSPNNAEREAYGYSGAWLHHKGRNKHHYEYWIDYSKHFPGQLLPVPMPDRYIGEMLMDRVAASKVYAKDKYTDSSPLQYYYQGTHLAPIHEDTRAKLLYYLKLLSDSGEKAMFQQLKKDLKHNDLKREA